mmetsp:Transcript_13535/g.40303  ORF Transcript_13535/g.40303 Transcript_13535/m.40303 type:complete len:217 (+) Transcript_13535:236-886(+)
MRSSRIPLLLLAASRALALRPLHRRDLFSAAAAVVAPATVLAPAAARAEAGVPMDLGPLGLRVEGASGKLNVCPPKGVKRGCLSTSQIEQQELYVPPWTFAGPKDDKSVEQAVAELVAAIETVPGATVVDKGTKAGGRYVRAEVKVPGSPPFGSDQLDDVEFLIAGPGVDPPHLVNYHSVTRTGGSGDAKRHRERIKAIRLELQEKGWKSVGRLLL